MRVLVISPGYLMLPAVNGGAIECLIDTITEENEKFKKVDFTVFSIYDGSDTSLFSKKENCDYKYIDIRKLSYRIKRVLYALINKMPNVYIGKAYIREVAKVIKKENKQYDAVVIENNPIFALVISKVVNCPIILHLHNDYLNINNKLEKKVLKSLTSTFTVSDYIGSRIKTIDSNTKKVRTLYNGINLKQFDKEISEVKRNEIRKKYGVDENDKVLLYTGRIMPEKGVKELIQAFINLKKDKSYDNLKLLIVGSSFFKNAKITRYQKELMDLCQGYENDIIFTGYINHDKIYEIYKSCDIQIVPSIWGEPLATTVIEGMASGIPLIVNNVGGIPEMADKNCALYCETESLVADIEENVKIFLKNKNNIKEKLVDNALKKVQIFEKTIFYNNYINNLTDIIEDGKHG